MKNRYAFNLFRTLLIVCFTVSYMSGHSQDKGRPVQFKNGNFIPDNTQRLQSFNRAAISSSLWGNNYYVLVQFTELPFTAVKEQLRLAGLELGTYISGNAYLAVIKIDFDFSLAERTAVSSVSSLPPIFKKDPQLFTYRAGNEKTAAKTFAVSYYPSADREMVQEALQRLGAAVVTTGFKDAPVIFIRPNRQVVEDIANLPFVSYISLQSVTDKSLNYNGVGLQGVSALLSPSGRKLSGKNVAVGVGDNAEISTHIDFTGRLINRVFSGVSFHGIHTSGTVAGAGILDVRNHGMAPKSTIISQTFSDIITNTPTYITDYNMIATNNSYTAADDGCPGEGVYDVLSNYADGQMKDHETVLHVFSAGNDGFYSCSPFAASFGTIKTGWQCSKNVITVGAIDQANYTLAAFSSRGPVQDGRLKPEIVASGINVLSTRHFNSYGYNSGTSMSGPMVAGAITVLNERYRQLNAGATPKAALLKALLCNTAEDLGNPGPDYTFGFGLMNARKAAEAMEANHYYISTAAPASYPITVPAGVRRLKVMLYWADPAAAANAGTTLINDLDLTVTAPGPTTLLPLVLDPTPANVNLPAVQGADHRNNIEQVVIDNPSAGTYNFNVTAFSVPQGPQEYILTYQEDMNGITVEYPYGGESWVPGETETIRWTAYGDESNSFSIDSSFDNGATWGKQ